MILKDKIIIVTGGSGLLGKAIVQDIKNKGGIAINADINVT
jgi:NAD(P)-dependent dehydrogenase (short-subunit alcohol dehydrogenase family)